MVVKKRHIIDLDNLPEQYPTNYHEPLFWEALGRAVATFGFLEEVLGRAIFAFSATRKYAPERVEEAYEKWLPTLERALSDPLGNLIDTYASYVRKHQDASIENLDDLIDDLRKISKLRNVLCHGSWRYPDKNKASTPFFCNRQKEQWTTPIDVKFVKDTQQVTAKLACVVINTVTHMGLRFPGSNGPGKPI